jgi:4-amino-4-deoxychorismate lyase
MFLLIETICYEKGAFQRVPLHEERMNRSRTQLFAGTERLSLAQLLCIPEVLKDQKVKCRVTYAREIEKIEYEPYIPRKIRSLKLITDDSIEYAFKLRNRRSLNDLWNQRGDADEILIVKKGQITDTSFTNIVFLKDGTWFTPKFPLLPGTRREDYLQKKLIVPRIIRPDELCFYEEAKLINAFLSLEEAESIPITSIF